MAYRFTTCHDPVKGPPFSAARMPRVSDSRVRPDRRGPARFLRVAEWLRSSSATHRNQHVCRHENLHEGSGGNGAQHCRAVQPRIRARFVWCGNGRRYARPSQQGHRRQGDHRPAEPGAPRRPGRRTEHRRRRGHPDPGSRRVPTRDRRLRPAGGGQLRHRHCLPAAVLQGRGAGLRSGGQDHRGRGPESPGLACGPHRRFLAGRTGPRRDAHLPPTLHLRRLRYRTRAPGLCDPQARRARAGQQGSGTGWSRSRNRVLPKPFRADAGLQGHADDAAAQGVLSRFAGRADGQRAGHRALAVLDQHVPVLAVGPPVPDGRPQR